MRKSISQYVDYQIFDSQPCQTQEKAQSNAEVDLLYAYNKWVIPIEIKSGNTGSLKSLHQFIEAVDHPYAIRMYAGAFKLEKAVTPNKKPYLLMNLPYYAGTSLPRYIEWFVQQKDELPPGQ